jgi:hypothetical protein
MILYVICQGKDVSNYRMNVNFTVPDSVVWTWRYGLKREKETGGWI